MRGNMMKIVKVGIIILFLTFLSCTSCSSSDTGSDNDSDHDLQDSPDLHDDLSDDSPDEVLTESDETLDSDADEDSDLDCPEHKEAGYPYYRKDGTIHFCRECDTPTETDPDCISNLWVDGNEKLYAEHPDKDCLGYPCMMENLSPIYYENEEVEGLLFLDKCDMELSAENPVGWQTGMVTFKHYNLSEGKVGLVMNHVSTTDLTTPIFKAVEFDIETRSYRFVRPGEEP